MRSLVGVGAAGVGLWAVQRWLPRSVVALRVRIFTKVNGDDEVTLPGELGGPEVFERVYADPAANGRSRGDAAAGSGARTTPRSSTASRPTPSASKRYRWRYAREAAARGIATHVRSAPTWYAVA